MKGKEEVWKGGGEKGIGGRYIFLRFLFLPLPPAPAMTLEMEDASDDFDMVLRNACRAALKKGLLSDPNDLLVVTAGIPFGTPGAANVIRVVPAAGPSCWDGVCRVD